VLETAVGNLVYIYALISDFLAPLRGSILTPFWVGDSIAGPGPMGIGNSNTGAMCYRLS